MRALADRVAPNIQPEIPAFADEFLTEQRYAVVASVDEHGRRWASMLVGPPGFLQVLDERTLRIDAHPVTGDPLAANLATADAIGVLAIELATRRRMKLKGHASTAPDGAIELTTERVYALCPKFIQRRVAEARYVAPPGRRDVSILSALTPRQQRLIRAADTFFIATADPHGTPDAAHRGGNPGFVHVVDERTLLFPDYPGNNMFNTFGNLAASHRARSRFHCSFHSASRRGTIRTPAPVPRRA